MKKLYENSQLGFALGWIGVYVVGFSLADGLSETLGVEKVLTAPLGILIAAVLIVWIVRSGLQEKFGLVKVNDPKRFLYFLPLLLPVSMNLWCGVQLNMSVPETVLYVLAMLCVGVIEEVLFRGFLLRAMSAQSPKWAVVVASVTFGLGHIVNLLNGADFIPTLLQVIYATTMGFLFTVIVLRSGSLLPCIAAHSLVNGLSAFSVEQQLAAQVVFAGVLTLFAVGYALLLLRPQGNGTKGDLY